MRAIFLTQNSMPASEKKKNQVQFNTEASGSITTLTFSSLGATWLTITASPIWASLWLWYTNCKVNYSHQGAFNWLHRPAAPPLICHNSRIQYFTCQQRPIWLFNTHFQGPAEAGFHSFIFFFYSALIRLYPYLNVIHCDTEKKNDIMQVNEGVKKTILHHCTERTKTCITQSKLKHMFPISTQSLTLLWFTDQLLGHQITSPIT